jgi:NAD+ diphosphatase
MAADIGVMDWNEPAELDLATVERHDPAWADARWRAPGARVLLVTPEGEFAWRRPGVLAWVEAVGERDRETDFFVAVRAGVSVFMRLVRDKTALEAATGGKCLVAGLRGLLDAVDDDLGLGFAAAFLGYWHGNARYCPRCSAATEVVQSGHARYCRRCERELFPRTDPAVIVSVLDGQDRILLGRQPVWAPRRVSVFAGFVEGGESAEQAVHREIAEEVGISALGRPRYFGSQPWPFPRSLMLAYVARAAETEIRLDVDEIEEARWFTRAELRAAVASGEVLLPSRHSIAHRMIAAWRTGAISGEV